MRERPLIRLTFGVYQITDWPTLHEDNGVVSILPHRRGGQTIHIFCLCSLQHFFKCERRHVVTFVHNDHSIVLYKRFDLFFLTLEKRLHDGDVNDPAPCVLSRADLTDQTAFLFPATLFRWLRQNLMDSEELLQRCPPLLQQCTGVYQNQSVDLSLPDQIRPDHPLTKGCGS